MGNAPKLPHLLQVRPCLILLGTAPVLSQRSLAEQSTLGDPSERAVFKNGDERAMRGPEWHRFEQMHFPQFINHGFDRSNHGSALTRKFTPLWGKQYQPDRRIVS